jgi:hypothetical protein
MSSALRSPSLRRRRPRSLRPRTQIASLVTVLVLAASWLVAGAPASIAATYACGPSNTYTLCLTMTDGALAGDQTIYANATEQSTTGAPIARLEFTWNGAYLIYRYQAPYEFVWPTAKFLDGTGQLSARVVSGGVPGAWVTMQVTLANGNVTAIPRNPANSATAFAPQPYSGEPVIAAVGSGGAGKAQESDVITSIKAHKPAAFLYLGDVDEFGNWTTYVNNYGVSALDDPTGSGTLWGSMARYTAPTPGNHENGSYVSSWQDYWHQRPLWSTFTIGDVRLFDLNSNCGALASCTASAQTTWLAGQLAANTSRCVVAFWHIPQVSEDYARNGTKMAALWTLLANNGGDLVVNAHTHDMEVTAPLNAAGVAGQPDSHMVELVSGGAGGRWELQYQADPRVLWELYHTAGSLYFTTVHHPDGSESITWWFEDTLGGVLRTGSVTC